MKTRARIIKDAKRLRAGIKHIFCDAQVWNYLHPEEAPIDPDPDKTLEGLFKAISKMLSEECPSKKQTDKGRAI